MDSGTDYRRALVASQFHRARRRAALESLLARFSGQPLDLLSFNEVIDKLGIAGQSTLGVRQIPLEAIVGSVGRYQDFTRTFLPRLETDEDRWVRVGAAAPTVADLPPIEVYKIDEAYFVLDGNHRVSLARQQNLHYIDAEIIEVRTRAPLPADLNPDRLIIAAELHNFLEATRLDLLRPESDLMVSVPGQYRHLESHIEAYRFVLEETASGVFSFEEAVIRWHDDVYRPLVEAIREQGILRYFPNRTETDFFIWLSRHRAELQNELGVTISDEVTVTRLLGRVGGQAADARDGLAERVRRWTRRTLNLPATPVPQRSWAEERTLSRYSDTLFATMLHPVIIDEAQGHTGPTDALLDHCLALDRAEGAALCVLCLLDHPQPTPAERQTIDRVAARLAAEPGECSTVMETGDPVHWIRELGFLNDLVIIERSIAAPPSRPDDPTDVLRAVIEQLDRPIWVASAAHGPLLPQRVLVVHDTRRSLDESIFIAAYLAERWRAELAVLPLSNGYNTSELVEHINAYLALHEVSATFLDPVRPNRSAVATIVEEATAGGFDLLLITGPDRGRKTNRQTYLTDVVWPLLHAWPHSVLIAT